MAIVVKFEWPAGTDLGATRFDPGQQLHIAVTIDGWPGNVYMYISPEQTGVFTPIVREGGVNMLGHIAFDVVLPNVITKANVFFDVDWEMYPGTMFNESRTIPIGIGTDPSPLPQPWDLKKVLTYSAIGLGAVLVWTSLVRRR